MQINELVTFAADVGRGLLERDSYCVGRRGD